MQEKTGEENGDEVKMLEGHIEDLRAEIASLQRQKEELNRDSMLHFEGAMLDALLIVGGQTQNRDEETVMFKLKEEVEELEKDLHLQTEMNGISVDDCKIKTLFSSGREWTHQVCVSLQCSQMVLQVDFQITETKVGRGSEKKIVGLNVVLDSDELQNFSGFLSRVEESLDLPLLFRTLRNFSDRCDERSRTFQHFQETFPSVASLPGGCRSEVMVLRRPELPGCVLFIHWAVEISTEGTVVPKINLLTKLPEQALERFPSQPVGGAAEAFQSLLRMLGAEGAVESVLRALVSPVGGRSI
ncbi:centromere protein P isoform X2 [Oryzias melastigma]|nr:centromere protein P isoform X2 [Oryzias melastigma]XP_036067998.1 centromere protein P isoform X2 [Oryzias melastigma]